MKLSGDQILMAAEYVKQNGRLGTYTIGNVIPEGSIGYKQYISTKGAEKLNIADPNLV